MMIEKSKKNFGYSLVEIMVAILIFSAVLGIGYTLLNRTFVSMQRQKQSLDTLHEARYFLAMIERDLREMTRIISFDTAFKNSLFDENNALFYSMKLEVPDRKGNGYKIVTYSYEGPNNHEDVPGNKKMIYRQVEGDAKTLLIKDQLDYLKVWGTDGVIFRNREVTETMEAYRHYLTPHYYFPSNPAPNGLKDLDKVRGIEIRLSMHEMFDSAGKPIKNRLFVTRVYPRVINAKYD